MCNYLENLISPRKQTLKEMIKNIENLKKLFKIKTNNKNRIWKIVYFIRIII